MTEEPLEEDIDINLSGSPFLFDESSYCHQLRRGGTARVFTRTRTRESGGEDERPLFVDDVWPGCKYLARFLDDDPGLDFGSRNVLELGAGCSLPSVIAAKRGASKVVATDFPAPGVIETIKEVFTSNSIDASKAEARALRWGNVEEEQALLSLLPEGVPGYNLILAAEPLWQDTVSSHSALAHSISRLLSPSDAGAVAYLCFCHRPNATHRPEHDLHFFTKAAQDHGLCSEKVRTISGEYSDVLEYSAPIDVHLYRLWKEPSGKQ